MGRTFDPDLDYLHVQRGGTILLEGEDIGTVFKLSEGEARLVGSRWRAEIGNVAEPEAWPPYRVAYSRTRWDAVLAVLDGLVMPS